MYKSIIYFLLLFYTSHFNIDNDEKANRLSKIYDEIIKNKSKEEHIILCNEFFICFPDSFRDFVYIFQCRGKYKEKNSDNLIECINSLYRCDPAGKLEKLSYLYLGEPQKDSNIYSYPSGIFLNLDTIVGKEKYINKIITLLKNSFLVGGAIATLHSIVEYKLELYPENFLQYLSLRDKSSVRDFWDFYFGVPHPELPEFLIKYKEKYPYVYKEMHEAFHDALKESCPGH